MVKPRPFRFNASVIPVTSRAELVAYARKVEALGYSALCHGDHPAFGGLAPLPAFLIAAEATTSFASEVVIGSFTDPSRPWPL